MSAERAARKQNSVARVLLPVPGGPLNKIVRALEAHRLRLRQDDATLKQFIEPASPEQLARPASRSGA